MLEEGGRIFQFSEICCQDRMFIFSIVAIAWFSDCASHSLFLCKTCYC